MTHPGSQHLRSRVSRRLVQTSLLAPAHSLQDLRCLETAPHPALATGTSPGPTTILWSEAEHLTPSLTPSGFPTSPHGAEAAANNQHRAPRALQVEDPSGRPGDGFLGLQPGSAKEPAAGLPCMGLWKPEVKGHKEPRAAAPFILSRTHPTSMGWEAEASLWGGGGKGPAPVRLGEEGPGLLQQRAPTWAQPQA